MSLISDWTNKEEKICLFCGAGFSKWAVGLPTARDLFDFKIKINKRETKKLALLVDAKKNWNLQHPGGQAEEFIDFMINSEKKEDLVTWYIERRLADPFIWEENRAFRQYRHVLMIDENRKYSVNGIRKTKNFLNFLSGSALTGIITTNYDMVIEYALGTKGFNYGQKYQPLHGRGPYPVSTFQKPVIVSGNLPLVKLHGSISLTEHGYCSDGRGGITGKALIIPPTRNKHFRDQVAFEWDLAREIIQKSERIIFFGFAFNPYDQDINELLAVSKDTIKKIR